MRERGEWSHGNFCPFPSLLVSCPLDASVSFGRLAFRFPLSNNLTASAARRHQSPYGFAHDNVPLGIETAAHVLHPRADASHPKGSVSRKQSVLTTNRRGCAPEVIVVP